MEKQLFRSGSLLLVAYAAGLILLLFGLYFTVFAPPESYTKGGSLGSLLFNTLGGWLLLTGIALFLITLTLRDKKKGALGGEPHRRNSPM